MIENSINGWLRADERVMMINQHLPTYGFSQGMIYRHDFYWTFRLGGTFLPMQIIICTRVDSILTWFVINKGVDVHPLQVRQSVSKVLCSSPFGTGIGVHLQYFPQSPPSNIPNASLSLVDRFSMCRIAFIDWATPFFTCCSRSEYTL